MPNSKSVVQFLQVDFGWCGTILWMVGDHPGDGELPSMVVVTWSPGFDVVSEV